MPGWHVTFDRKSNQNSPLETFGCTAMHPLTVAKISKAAFIEIVWIVQFSPTLLSLSNRCTAVL